MDLMFVLLIAAGAIVVFGADRIKKSQLARIKMHREQENARKKLRAQRTHEEFMRSSREAANQADTATLPNDDVALRMYGGPALTGINILGNVESGFSIEHMRIVDQSFRDALRHAETGNVLVSVDDSLRGALAKMRENFIILDTVLNPGAQSSQLEAFGLASRLDPGRLKVSVPPIIPQPPSRIK